LGRTDEEPRKRQLAKMQLTLTGLVWYYIKLAIPAYSDSPKLSLCLHKCWSVAIYETLFSRWKRKKEKRVGIEKRSIGNMEKREKEMAYWYNNYSLYLILLPLHNYSFS